MPEDDPKLGFVTLDMGLTSHCNSCGQLAGVVSSQTIVDEETVDETRIVEWRCPNGHQWSVESRVSRTEDG